MNESKQESAVEYCEREYPGMTEEFKNILDEMYLIFCKKQKNYGPSNISQGTQLSTPDEVKLSLMGLYFRKNDKIQRIKQLVVLNHQDEVDEPVEETYLDLAVYSVISQIVCRDKWNK